MKDDGTMRMVNGVLVGLPSGVLTDTTGAERYLLRRAVALGLKGGGARRALRLWKDPAMIDQPAHAVR